MDQLSKIQSHREQDLYEIQKNLKRTKQKSNLRQIKQNPKDNNPIKNDQTHVMFYNTKKSIFELKQICLSQNILYVESDRYLILRKTTLYINKLTQYEPNYYLMTLENNEGSTTLLFSNRIQFQTWENKIEKQSCKPNFYQKFQLLNEMTNNYFFCEKRKVNPIKLRYQFQQSNKQYLYKVICEKELENNLDKIEQEIQFSYKMQGKNCLEVHQVYKEKCGIYIVYKAFNGITLQDVFNKEVPFNEVQIAEIFRQLLQFVSNLNDQDLNHGALTTENVLLDVDSEELRVVVINFHQNFELPIVFQSEQFKGIRRDIYQIGVLLYFLTIFQINTQELNKSYFLDEQQFNPEDQLVINFNLLNLLKNHSSCQNLENSAFPQVFSQKQIQFNERLLLDKNLTIKDALNDDWLIKIQSFPSLNILSCKSLKDLLQSSNNHRDSLKLSIDYHHSSIDQQQEKISQESCDVFQRMKGNYDMSVKKLKQHES